MISFRQLSYSTSEAARCFAGWYDERIEIVKGGKHAEGEMVDIYRDPCQDGYQEVELVGQVPQVAETYTYFDTGYPFMNEKGLTIGEHTWSGDYTSFYNGEKALLVIANLQALGLQRASTAKECIQIMGELAEKYGVDIMTMTGFLDLHMLQRLPVHNCILLQR